MAEQKNEEDLLVINVESGIAALSGDRQMFFSMLEQFEGLSFTAGMEIMFQAIKDKNWKEVQAQGHTLKGTSGYIHAEKFYYQCEKLQSSLKDQIKINKFTENENIIEYFKLLENAKEMKIELDKLNNKSPDPSTIESFIEEIIRLYPYVIEQPLQKQLTKQSSTKDKPNNMNRNISIKDNNNNKDNKNHQQQQHNNSQLQNLSPKLEKEVAPKESMCKNCNIF